jgi:non-ribosomal peptide synthetase component F
MFSTTIVRMTGHLQALITAISRNPDQKIADLQMINETEMRQLTVGFAPASTLKNASYGLVHRLIEAHAKQTPEAVAVACRDERLSYGELNQRANRLAFHLRSIGIGAESVVAVCMERSPELIVALLAIWKAGAAYVPLNPSHPQERLAFIIKQVNAPLLMSLDGLRPDLGAHVPKVLHVDFASSMLSSGDDGNLAIQQQDTDSLAYVIFTSGSTGNPKGVMVSQASLLSVYLGWQESYELTSGGSHLQMANFSFDVFVGDLTRALCSGSKLVICPEEIMLAPENLYRLMQAEKTDSAEFVPQVVRMLVAYLKNAGLRLEFLRNLIVGSDSWYVTEYESLKQFCGAQTRVINSYGVTEATIDSTFFQGQIEGVMSSENVSKNRFLRE